MATLNIFNPIDFHIFQKGNNYRLYSKVPVKYLEFHVKTLFLRCLVAQAGTSQYTGYMRATC